MTTQLHAPLGGTTDPSLPPERRATPLARRLAQERHINLAHVTGSGPYGRILSRDIKAARQSSPHASAWVADTSPQPFTLEKPSSMRTIIAERLTHAKQTIPHFYLSADCRLDALLALRAQYNAHLATQHDDDLKVSINDLIIKAAALALMQVPEANVCWAEDGLRRYQRVDISVAVAIEGGLLTPVLRDVVPMPVAVIARSMQDLAARAREGKLLPEDYQGGSFSISNLGMFGVRDFAAVINPPQACILAVGAGVKTPVAEGNTTTIATVMTVTLSVDHRAVDGAVGARFLQAFTAAIEAPLAVFL